jgi:hypothetical protein
MSTFTSSPRAWGTVAVSALSGARFACKGDNMVLLMMADTQRLYLPCFTSKARLRKVLSSFDTIHQIEAAREFTESLPKGGDGMEARLILDPHFTPGPSMAWADVACDFMVTPEFPGSIIVLAFAGAS